jgi:hypothetical protein
MRRSYGRSRRFGRRAGTGSSAPLATNSAYSFVGGSFAALFPSSTGSPKTATDPVTGKSIRRYKVGAYDSAASPTLDYCSQQTTTVIVVWRARNFYPNALQPILDSSSNGTTNGYQIAAWDFPSGSRTRQVFPRVSNGASWVVDHAATTPADGYEAGVWNITVLTTSATRLLSQNLHSTYLDEVVAASLPAGAAGAMVCGNSEVDVMAVEFYRGGLADALVPAAVDRLALACGNIDVVMQLAGDGSHYFADSGGCRQANNTIFSAWYHSTSGATNDAQIEYCTFDDTAHPIVPSATSIAPFSPAMGGGNGWFDPTAAKLANGNTILVANYTDLVTVACLQSSNNGSTWGSQVRITHGYTLLEICAAPIVQTSGGRLYCFVYAQGAARAHWDARAYYSDDGGATWPGNLLLADGVVDGKDYAEPGGVYLTQASIDGSLSAGTIYVMIRVDADSTMRECVISSVDGSPSVSAHVATGISGFSAARPAQASDATIIFEGRDNVQQRNTLYIRNGTGSWTAAPGFAPSVECTPGVGQYGAVCAERTTGTLPIVTAVRTNVTTCYTQFKNHPLCQLYQLMATTPRPRRDKLIFGFDASDSTAVWPGASANLMGSVEGIRRNYQNGSASDMTSPSTHQPAYGVSTINSRNYLDFSNAVTSYAVCTLPSGITDLTLEAVIKTGVDVSGNYCMFGNAVTGTGPVAMSVVGGVLRLHDYGTGGNILFTDLAVSINTTYRVVFRRTGNNWDAWLNATKSTLGASGGVATALSTEFLFATDSSASVTEQFAGGIAEAYLWNVALTDAQITADYTPLKAKWALP